MTNGYNFDFAMSAKISPDVVKVMIAKIAEEQTNRKVAKVELNMRSVSRGSQLDEYTETIFDGATVYFASNDNSTR
jgi:hypothetical protein